MLYPGLYPAIIDSVVDPEARNRVTLLIPLLFGNHSTGWAEPVRTQGRVITLPTKGLTTWAAFQGGDKEFPLWFP